MEDVDIDTLKISFIGGMSVGKSSIIRRYIHDQFEVVSQSNITANFESKVIKYNGKAITIELWDTAGQEKYRSIGKLFYKDSYIICLVYDIAKRESFQDLKDKWYKDVSIYGEKYKIIAIVGNKLDLYETEEVSEEEEEDLEDIKHK